MTDPVPHSTAAVVDARRHAATCRWATPTIFLDAPLWLESEDTPWSCVRDRIPRLLNTTDECVVCPRWQPRRIGEPEGGRAGAVQSKAETHPLMLDWFNALPPPHEMN